MEFLAIILFSLAVSGDGLMVGVAYGIRNIKIPVISLLVIALSSALAVSVSMVLGKALSLFISPHQATTVGSVMILMIGMYFMLQAGRQKIMNLQQSEQDPLLTLNVNSLGIIIQILKKPVTADFDSSGEISLREAFFLGLALAMDALGAGVGLALAGMNIFFTAISVGMVKFILVNTGIRVGQRIQNERWQSLAPFLTGLIFITVAMIEYM
ncbi:MAG TPA: sporulation membrane protein YtaF [Syntrophomonas sp.]|nr:sporulation membrane protein YtaF [Syntrophomonas sp.]